MLSVMQSARLLFALSGVLLLSGCGDPEPVPPRFVYDQARDVIIKPVQISAIKAISGPSIQPRRTVAVLTFKSPGDTQGGPLVSDVFSMALRSRGFQVVERDYVDRLIGEQQLAADKRVALSDLEIGKRLGGLIAADYLLIGATTLYKSEPQTVNLPIRIKNEDRALYKKDYEMYRANFVEAGILEKGLSYLPVAVFQKTKERKIALLRSDKKILSLEEIEEELKKTYKPEFQVIATIGISAKLIDVKSSNLIWLGQGETVDFTLVGGSGRIIEKMLEHMLAK